MAIFLRGKTGGNLGGVAGHVTRQSFVFLTCLKYTIPCTTALLLYHVFLLDITVARSIRIFRIGWQIDHCQAST